MRRSALLFLFAICFAMPLMASPGSVCRDFFLGGETSQILSLTSGQKIVYRLNGSADSAEVVVLLNGLGQNMRQWDSVRSRLQKSADESESRLYVQIDLLGEGTSAKLNRGDGPLPQEISFEEQVQALHELIEAKGWAKRRLTLAGHSYGGGIAARYARDFPGRVRDVILVAPFVDNLELSQPVASIGYAWLKIFAEFVGSKSLYDTVVMSQSEMAMMASWPAYSFTTGSQASLHDVLAMTRGNRNLQMNSSVAKMGTTKVSMICSSFDEMVPAIAHHDLWNHIPIENSGSYSVVISAHDSVTYRPDAIADRLQTILSSKP